jgi:DNA-binding winged helix-turn-helix (wHTH) protein
MNGTSKNKTISAIQNLKPPPHFIANNTDGTIRRGSRKSPQRFLKFLSNEHWIDMSKTTRHIYKFGPFRLDTREHLLLRDSESVPLTIKSFKTLLLLVENSGHVVERSELLEQVWPNTFVEEANLTQQVFTLRKILGTDQNGRQYIETVPKLGYRFTATVSGLSDEIGGLAENVHAQALLITEDTSPDKTIDSIAVLPLAIVSSDPDTEYLSDGITESIISHLAQLPRLRVMALSTVLRYRGKDLDPQKIGRRLNVRAIVTGRIIELENSLIFRVELVDAIDGSRLFGKEYKRTHSGAFDAQEEISGTISRELQIRLTIENE